METTLSTEMAKPGKFPPSSAFRAGEGERADLHLGLEPHRQAADVEHLAQIGDADSVAQRRGGRAECRPS